MNELKQVVEESGFKEKTSVAADKGYSSHKKCDMLKEKKIKVRVMRKGARGRVLTERKKIFNHLKRFNGLTDFAELSNLLVNKQ
jgi:IS5 family transposase